MNKIILIECLHVTANTCPFPSSSSHTTYIYKYYWWEKSKSIVLKECVDNIHPYDSHKLSVFRPGNTYKFSVEKLILLVSNKAPPLTAETNRGYTSNPLTKWCAFTLQRNRSILASSAVILGINCIRNKSPKCDSIPDLYSFFRRLSSLLMNPLEIWKWVKRNWSGQWGRIKRNATSSGEIST